MSAIEIVPVDGLGRFMTFSKLPRLLYAGANGFAPSLDVERWTNYAHRLNPHFKRVDAQEFLARRDGRWVGRIAAQIYKPDIEPVGASRAQFGALDAIDDIEVVRALTEAAESWLAARGATRINGPFSPSINNECGLLVEGFETTPMVFMPWHPPYLARHLDALGYEKAQDLYSYRLELSSDELDKPARISTRREWRDRLTLRPLNMKALKQGETALMAELFNDGWSGNWGFVPFGRTNSTLKPTLCNILSRRTSASSWSSTAFHNPSRSLCPICTKFLPISTDGCFLSAWPASSPASKTISSRVRACCCSERANHCRKALPAALSFCR